MTDTEILASFVNDFDINAFCRNVLMTDLDPISKVALMCTVSHDPAEVVQLVTDLGQLVARRADEQFLGALDLHIQVHGG